MERPSKRRRLSDGADEEEFDLGEARARNNLKLKSRFESIFEKYSQDFSSMGDEIDLKTGAIVVNNGHLEEMQDEQDIGRTADRDEPEDMSSMSSNEDPEFDWVDHDGEFDEAEPSLPPNLLNVEIDGDADSHLGEDYDDNIQRERSTSLNHPEHLGSESERDGLLSSFLSSRPVPASASKLKHYGNGNHDGTISVETHAIPAIQETPSTSRNPPKPSPIEPLWQTPEIDGLLPSRISKSAPTYTPPDRATPVSPSGGRSLWAGPWTRHPRKDKGAKRGPQRPRSTLPKRKLFSKADLQALRNFNFSETGVDSDDSDDPLQDVSYSTPMKRPSPSPDVVKHSNGSNTPSGSNKDGKKLCKPNKEESAQDEPDHDCDTVLRDDKNDEVHSLEKRGELQAPRPEPVQPGASREHEDSKNKLISSEVTVPTPVPVSNTPMPQKSSPKQRIRSQAKTAPSQIKENGVQPPPDKEKTNVIDTIPSRPQKLFTHQRNNSPAKASPSQQNVNRVHKAQPSPDKDNSNNIDPFDDEFDNISTTSGLSSMQIEPSPVKTPRGKRGFSSPLAARSSAKEGDQGGRFSLFAKRPIKVPIFRRP
ncbi:hypothetical protein FQN54_003391 [Arachnomyces sp. PD_36]|nr:hypothetical protein FQN54_003391 [Arachnomyces sp. PD_36]